LDCFQSKLVKNKAAVPIKVKLLRNCQFKVGKMLLPRSEHSGSLDIGILLNLVLRISGEEHREKVVERNTTRHDVPTDNKRKHSSGRSCRLQVDILVPFAVHNDRGGLVATLGDVGQYF